MVEVASELGARGSESSGIHLCLSHFTDFSRWPGSALWLPAARSSLTASSFIW